MFQSKTGWAAVVLAVLGALTAADILPMVSAALSDLLGQKVAHSVGAVLALLGAVVAKLSQPAPTPPAE